MTIKSIEYFSSSGFTCQGVFGVSTFPYSDRNVQYDGGPIGARWHHDGHEVSWAATDEVSIYPSPDMRFLVVVFLRDPPVDFSCPDNALVLNADGTVRSRIRQPTRYAGRATEFLDTWWYEREVPQPQPPWWAFWRAPVLPRKEVRMMVLVGGRIGLPNLDFEALDFDPETGVFGEVVESGRL